MKHNARSGSRLYDTLMVFGIHEIIFFEEVNFEKKIRLSVKSA